MSVNPNIFIHETDRAAMEALEAIPGFSRVMKSFMSSWSEKTMYIENMSTNIRISEKQFPVYDAMLKEISEQLGIEKPDLFLKMDVVPNAYSSGETKPFIVITSGLVSTMPENLIRAALAHECGHIVCHHVLYRTMGRWVLSGALAAVPIAAAAIYPLMAAFRRWMRCSELSADRAAILCEGSADSLVDLCMHFAGYDTNNPYPVNREAFLEQAREFHDLVTDSRYNKTLEQMRFLQASHPLNATRALEGLNWTETENCSYARAYFTAFHNGDTPAALPVSWKEKSLNGKDVNKVKAQLEEEGFANVVTVPVNAKTFLDKENTVASVRVPGETLADGTWIGRDEKIEVRYFVNARSEKKN